MHAFLSTLGFSDVIDVVATSVAIYYFLLLIRGTRAVQMVTGVLVLLGILGIANLLHLYLLSTILRWLLVGAAVTLPIVFQPELRRALERLGRGGFLHRDGDGEAPWVRAEDRSVAALASAAFLLSRHRLGALIAIEQQSGLKEFAESGTILDARISPELILAIFMPRSPLHDGALIVRNGAIQAAGCFLPLAEQTLTDRQHGTRHRAALGLSEQTDAVVLVVSEETGAITIAREGKLTRPVEDETRLLKMLLAVTRAPRKGSHLGNDVISGVRALLTPHRKAGSARADHPQKLHT